MKLVQAKKSPILSKDFKGLPVIAINCGQKPLSIFHFIDPATLFLGVQTLINNDGR
jgi:hypothetical protein